MELHRVLGRDRAHVIAVRSSYHPDGSHGLTGSARTDAIASERSLEDQRFRGAIRQSRIRSLTAERLLRQLDR